MATPQSQWASTAIITLIILSLVTASTFAQGNQDAASAISEAEQAMDFGYKAVLEAEEAGGNVTSLLARLNDAVALLVNAQRAYNASRFAEAIDLAESASAAGDTVRSDAEKLEIEAAEASATRRTWYLTASFVAIPLVLAASFLSYRRFKKWYYQRLLKMKPEVGEA